MHTVHVPSVIFLTPAVGSDPLMTALQHDHSELCYIPTIFLLFLISIDTIQHYSSQNLEF